MTEYEMVGWHHRLNGHGFGWTPGVGDGQGCLGCCGSWGRKESVKQYDEKKDKKKDTVNFDDLQADLDSLVGLGTINDGDFRDDLSLDFHFQDGGKRSKEEDDDDDDKVLSELSELDLILEENSRTPSPTSTFTRKQASELKVPSAPPPCKNCESLKEKQTALETRKEELKKSISQIKESAAMLKGQLSMIDAMFAALPPFP